MNRFFYADLEDNEVENWYHKSQIQLNQANPLKNMYVCQALGPRNTWFIGTVMQACPTCTAACYIQPNGYYWSAAELQSIAATDYYLLQITKKA